MKRFPLGRWCLLALLLCVPHRSRAAGEDKSVIQPGEGVGLIRLAMREDRLISLLGTPPYKDAMMGSAWDDWYYKPLDGRPVEETNVMLRHDENNPGQWCVRQVTFTSPFFHTYTGVCVASDVATIWKEYPDLVHTETEEGGDGTQLEMYDSRAKGIGFLIQRTAATPSEGEPWGKCRAIIVHRANESARFDRIGKYVR